MKKKKGSLGKGKKHYKTSKVDLSAILFVPLAGNIGMGVIIRKYLWSIYIII